MAGTTNPYDWVNPYENNKWTSPEEKARYDQWNKEHPEAAAGTEARYDEEGYLLPTQQQIDAFRPELSYAEGNRATVGTVAYDPSLGKPLPDSDNPYGRGTVEYNTWQHENDRKKWNEKYKAAWQEQHKDTRKTQPSTASAPTPFASSGIDLTKEGKGETFDDSVIGYYGEHGIPQGSNEAQVTLDRFRASQPQDLSPYYDYASKLTSAKIDNAMSARGSYGSSNATGQIGAAEMALRADEAKANAQYGLDRFAAEGNFAGSADASAARKSALEFEWAKGLSDIAHRAQDAGEARNDSLWTKNLALAGIKSGNYTDATGKAIEGTTAATDAANDVTLGSANDKVSGATSDENVAASHRAAIEDAANKFGTNYYNYNTGEETKRHNLATEASGAKNGSN